MLNTSYHAFRLACDCCFHAFHPCAHRVFMNWCVCVCVLRQDAAVSKKRKEATSVGDSELREPLQKKAKFEVRSLLFVNVYVVCV
jgi:hypothetical protein